MQPVIGITRCSTLGDYVTSVEQSGGRVRVLEVSESPQAVVGEVHGILLTGGGDVDPVFYGEDRHPSVHDAEPGRDEFEIDLARRAMERDLPLLAICRGAQVLNVAAGGTLIQDIPSQVTGALDHKQAVPPHQSYDLAHEVWLEKDSLLARLMRERLSDTDSCEVNSRHHQAVGRVAPSFVVSAVSEDGVVEAIERPESTFCVGVQWHPENFWRTGEFAALFADFVKAARAKRPRP